MDKKRSSIRWLKIEITIDLNGRMNQGKKDKVLAAIFFGGQKWQNKTPKSKYEMR